MRWKAWAVYIIILIPGSPRTRIHQLRSLFDANFRLLQNEVRRYSATTSSSASSARSDRHQSSHLRRWTRCVEAVTIRCGLRDNFNDAIVVYLSFFFCRPIGLSVCLSGCLFLSFCRLSVRGPPVKYLIELLVTTDSDLRIWIKHQFLKCIHFIQPRLQGSMALKHCY